MITKIYSTKVDNGNETSIPKFPFTTPHNLIDHKINHLRYYEMNCYIKATTPNYK